MQTLFFCVPICRGCGFLLQGACFKRFPKRHCLGSVCPRTGCRCASWCASVLPYSPVLPEFAFSNAPVVQSRAPPFILWGGMCPFCVAQKRHAGTPTGLLFLGVARWWGALAAHLFLLLLPSPLWSCARVTRQTRTPAASLKTTMTVSLSCSVSCKDLPPLVHERVYVCVREVVVHCQALAQPSF